MVTDYSSVVFDMAYLNKPVIFYQKIVQHNYSLGHIDDTKDGFGPVVTDEAQLLREIEAILGNHGKPEAEYARRMRDFFPKRDGRNCERVYEAIINLDKPGSVS